jgi:hypothetical protein
MSLIVTFVNNPVCKVVITLVITSSIFWNVKSYPVQNQRTFRRNSLLNLQKQSQLPALFLAPPKRLLKLNYKTLHPVTLQHSVSVRVTVPYLVHCVGFQKSGNVSGVTVDSRLSARGLTALRLNRGNVFLKEKFYFP